MKDSIYQEQRPVTIGQKWMNIYIHIHTYIYVYRERMLKGSANVISLKQVQQHWKLWKKLSNLSDTSISAHKKTLFKTEIFQYTVIYIYIPLNTYIQVHRQILQELILCSVLPK